MPGPVREFDPARMVSADLDQQRMPPHRRAILAGAQVTMEVIIAEHTLGLHSLTSIGQNGYMNRGYSDQSYYGGRPAQSRPDSMIDSYSGQAQDAIYYPYAQNGQRRPRHYSRMSVDQGGYYGNGKEAQYTYQQQGYQRSNDNITAMSGSGSGYTDSYGQSTDPSSLNSSMDQLQQQALQQQRMDERVQAEYGYQGYGGSPNGYGMGYPAAPAPAASPGWGGPMAGTPSAAQPNTLRKTQNQASTDAGEKRKSWFKRRFSKD